MYVEVKYKWNMIAQRYTNSEVLKVNPWSKICKNDSCKNDATCIVVQNNRKQIAGFTVFKFPCLSNKLFCFSPVDYDDAVKANNWHILEKDQQ